MHEGGFGVTRNPQGEFLFTRPDGRHIPDAGAHHLSDREDLVGGMRRDQDHLDIHAMTCVPHMTDTHMDYGMAVDSMLARRQN